MKYVRTAFQSLNVPTSVGRLLFSAGSDIPTEAWLSRAVPVYAPETSRLRLIAAVIIDSLYSEGRLARYAENS
jgi:hypothetical protein